MKYTSNSNKNVCCLFCQFNDKIENADSLHVITQWRREGGAGGCPPGGTCQWAAFHEGGTDSKTKFFLLFEKVGEKLAKKKVGGSKIQKLQGKGKEKGGIQIFPPGGTLSHYATVITI